MTTQWHCKIDDQELGPLSFEELKQMVKDENLGRNDTVRQEKSDLWIPAHRVRGLFEGVELDSVQSESADKAVQSESSTVTETLPEESAPSVRPSPPQSDRDQRAVWLWGAAIGLSILLISFYGWRASNSNRFPEPTLRDPSAASGSAQRAPIPKEPTYEGLQVGVPVLVPGLESVPSAFSPCLTSDQRTIVFSGTGHPNTGYDLYIASRNDKHSPFGKPELIESCVAPVTIAYPTLRDDGLELFYRHGDVNSKFMVSRRNSLNEPFGAPIAWDIPGLKLGSEANLSTPQFLNDLELQWGISSPHVKQAGQYISARNSKQSKFGKPNSIPFSDPAPPYFVSQDRLRAYFGTQTGIHMCSRESAEAEFGPVVPLVDASISGPVDGTIYVVPQEDVIIYCSPGLDGPPGRRLLWMLRY